MTTDDVSTQTDELTTAPEDGEAIAAAEQAEQDAVGEHVVGYGCRVADRVYLAAGPGQRHRPYPLTIADCPGCGNPHQIIAMPRPRRPHDEIVLTFDPPPLTAQRKTKGTRSAAKSDAEIVAAVPAEWTPALQVAEALDYGNYKAFRNRLREMRKRADAKGEPLAFEVHSTNNGLKLRAAQ